MDSRLWLTPWTTDLKKSMDEELAFQKAYMQKMGLTLSPRDQKLFGGALLNIMLGLGDKKTADLINQFKQKTANVQGYPVVSSSEWFVTEDPKALARRAEEKAKADADEPAPDLSGGAGDIAGNLLGGFAKKKLKQNQAKKEKKQEGKPVFSTYHEVKSVTTATVPADQFEVPAGYKQVK
jgi:hypothetical protein